MSKFISLFLLISCFIFFATLPSYAHAQSDCSLSCSNGGTPSCSHVGDGRDHYPSCSNGSAVCCSVQGCYGGGLGPLCLQPQPTPPPITIYTCDPGYTTCPPNIAPTDPGGLCCLNGCCPSDSTKCKCSTNNQCSPNCTLSTPTPSTPSNPVVSSPTSTCNASLLLIGCMASGLSPNFVTCTCNPSTSTTPTTPISSPTTTSIKCATGLTACPSDTIPNFNCCPYGCCPSNPSMCRCSNSDQCDPNCNSSTPTTQPTATFLPTLTIIGIDSLHTSVNLKRYIIDLNVIGSNFSSDSSCSIYSAIAGLGIRIKPSDFFLSPSDSSKSVKVTIPLSKVIKRASSARLRFKAECSNGTEAEKVINLNN